MAGLDLYLRTYGPPQAPPLVLLHGLFGSAVNWTGIAHRLEADYRLLIPDLRNHGRSPRSEEMDYPSMAEDLLRLLDRQGLEQVGCIGHSLGGKVAMWLALSHGERVGRLVVADIAPVRYDHRFTSIFAALQGIDLSRLNSRGEAERLLARQIDSEPVRAYLLQNLQRQGEGWRWRCNLPVLQRALPLLVDFPEARGLSYPGEALFIHGERSEYLLPDYLPRIGRLFPHARVRPLPGAGHWLYAERPEEFTRLLRDFLGGD